MMTRQSFFSPRHRQHGVALIVALLVLAIATGIAASVIVRNQNAFNASAAFENGARADQLADSALTLAQALLASDDRAIDGPADSWAQPLDLPLPEGRVALQLTDLQGRFNLNNLLTPGGTVDELAKARFATLLSTLGIQTNFTDALIGWISKNPLFATASRSSRTPAGQPLFSVTELRDIPGISAADYRRLAPYVCALPVGTPVNLNSASAPVLIALGANPNRLPATTDAGGKPIPPKNIGSVADFLARPLFAGTTIPPEGLSVNSQFFLAKITVQIDNLTRHRYALLYRPASGAIRPIALSNEPCLTGFTCI